MSRIVEPQVFLIGETTLVRMNGGHGLQGFLSHLGVPDWVTHASSDSEELCEIAGKACYLSFSTDLNKNLTRVGTRNNHEYIGQQIIGQQHGSVLEHANVTLAFCNVSRIFTHELVRHRAGCAYSQVSGRYVRTDDIGYFLPGCIKEKPEAVQRFKLAFEAMEAWTEHLGEIFDIDNMKDFSLKKTLTSAFRRLIGNGQSNHIIMTVNHRALRNIIEMRTSIGAEEEMRNAFCKAFDMVNTRYPAFYADAAVHKNPGDQYHQVVFLNSKV